MFWKKKECEHFYQIEKTWSETDGYVMKKYTKKKCMYCGDEVTEEKEIV